MAEPEQEHHVERKVVYENVSASTTKNNVPVIIIITIVALGLVIWILSKLM